ncbi:hypothetical protein C8J57DRAFT_1472000 [Mycena rebaudengoi]|nr:hypothetical protein C8J57DRAFT_1472000 [Mycena rebaudengoi]
MDHGSGASRSMQTWHNVYAELKIYEDNGADPRSALIALVEGMSVSTSKSSASSLQKIYLQKIYEGHKMDPALAMMSLWPIKSDDRSLLDTSLAHLHDRLETNYVPSETERQEILDFCQQGRQRVSSLHWELDMHYYTTYHLQSQVSPVVAAYAPFEALISPMRTVPPEILQDLFVACLPSHHGAIMHISDAPLLLGRVCRLWRSIALGTPALWASLHAVVPASSADAERRCQEFQMWLQRSGDCPIRYHLFFPRELKLLAMPHEQLSKIFSLSAGNFPLLETIVVADPVYPLGEPATALEIMFVPTQLSSISLSSDRNKVPIPHCPWFQITTLRLECEENATLTGDMEFLLTIVGQCVNLQECSLVLPTTSDNTSIWATPLPAERHMTLSHLHSLTGTTWRNFLIDLSSPHFAAFISEKGRVTFYAQVPASDIFRALQNLLARSLCNLDKLCLEHIGGDMQFLLQCLQDCPSLRQLELCYRRDSFYPLVSDPANWQPSESGMLGILGALTADGGDPHTPGICPMLSTIQLEHIDINNHIHPAIVALLQYRCRLTRGPQITCLGKVDITLKNMAAFNIFELKASLFEANSVNRIEIWEPYSAPKHLIRWSGLRAQYLPSFYFSDPGSLFLA